MTTPVRVIQIVTQMNRAGLESRLMDIYRCIDRTRVQFDFYTCREEEGDFDKEIVSLGGKIYYNKPLSIGQLLSIPCRFSELFQRHPEYLIVHCHLNQWCGLILAGAKRENVPTRIAHSRTSLQMCNFRNAVKNFIKLPVNATSTHFFAVSEKAGVWLFGKKAVKRGEVIIWPNAIDCLRYRYCIETRLNVRRILGLGDSLTIIHVGNIRPEKNHQFLLKVFADVLKHKPESKLILVGNDYMAGQIQNKIKVMNIENNVLLLGMRTDIADLLQSGDIFVFPSIYEGFPGAVLEAQAAGIPCIISDTITDEVCLLPTTVQLSLKLPAAKWAENVLSMQRIERKDTFEELKAAGYDIKTLAYELTKFYLNAAYEKDGMNHES